VKDQYAENGQVGPSLLGTVYWLQGVTILWMLLECSFALFAAWKARSIAPLAFGSDSLVELLSALVVLIAFSPSVLSLK